MRLIEAGGFGTRRCRGESGSSVLDLSGPFASCGGSVLVRSALPTSEKPIAASVGPTSHLLIMILSPLKVQVRK